MIRIFSILLFLVAGFTASAQSKISIDDVKQHIGDSVEVCAKVFSTRFLESSNGTPTLINLGGIYPNEKLTVVIFGDNRGKFKEKPEDAWKDKDICITGKITEYRGKPQIVIAGPEQVKVN